MSDIYKLQYDGMTLTYPGWNGYVCYEKPAGYPITYLNDEHVSITGDSIYIPGSEGIALQSSYDTYYRISGYDITNGSIVDGKLVPTGPCTIKAVQKVNAFTASGQWQHINRKGGGNVRDGDYSSYPKITYRTSNVPTGWSASKNGVAAWNPGSNLSAYKMYNKMHIYIERGYGGYDLATAYYYIGSTKLYSIELNTDRTNSITYNRADSNIGIPCNYVHMDWYGYLSSDALNWSATGIAP